MSTKDDTPKNVDVNENDVEKNELIVTSSTEKPTPDSTLIDARNNSLESRIRNWSHDLASHFPHTYFVAGKWILYDARIGCYKELGEAGIDDIIYDYLITANGSSKKNKDNVKDLLKTLMRLRDEQWNEIVDLPVYIGKDRNFPPNDKIVTCPNGILDMRPCWHDEDPILMPSTPDWIITQDMRNPNVYDPSAECPTFTYVSSTSLGEDETLISNDVDDMSPAQLRFEEFMGYALTSDMSEEKFLYLNGDSRSGKGTLTDAMRITVGDMMCEDLEPTEMNKQFIGDLLRGKYCIFFNEMDSLITEGKSRNRIHKTIMAIVGRGKTATEGKFKAIRHSIQLLTRFIFSSNQYINISDPSGAWTNRMILIIFKRSFAGKEKKNLKNDLLKEGSGMLNNAIRGYRRLKSSGGFTADPDAEKVMKAEQHRFNPIVSWMLTNCVVDPALQSHSPMLAQLPAVEGANGEKNILWIDFKTFCEEHFNACTARPIDFNSLIQSVSQRIEIDDRNSRTKVKGKLVYQVRGIGLRDKYNLNDSVTKPVDDLIENIIKPATLDYNLSQDELDEIDRYPHPAMPKQSKL